MRAWQALTLSSDGAARVEPDATVNSVNDGLVAQLVDKHSVECVVLNICLLVDQAQIDRIGKPIVNIHNGITPRYRGSGNVFAMVEDNFDVVGVTLHRVDAGIDTGDLLSAEFFNPIQEKIPFAKIDETAFLKGVDLAIDFVRNGRTERPASLHGLIDRFYPFPGFSDWWRARRAYERRANRQNAGEVETRWQNSFAVRAKSTALPMHERLHWGDGTTLQWRDKTAIESIAADTPAGGTVLDVGCGEARLARDLDRFNYFGCDACVDFLTHADCKTVGAAEARRLPFADASFDTTFAIGLFQHLDQAQPVADEMIRVTKPGGKIIVNTLRTFSAVELIAIALGSLHNRERLALVGALWRGDYGAGDDNRQSVARRYAVRQVARMFGQHANSVSVTYHGGVLGRLFAREITIAARVPVRRRRRVRIDKSP